jgi:PIN domain
MRDMRIVLNTNVLVAGLMSRNGASHQILRGIALDVVDFVVSVPLFLEYEDVLKRPSFVRQTGLSAKDIDMVLDLLAANGHQTLLDFMWRPQLRDANGGAAAIVTFNQRDFLPAATTFGLRVITPGDYLPSIRGKLK